MTATPDLSLARRVLDDLRVSFPHLQILDDSDPHLDLGITIPVQAGMTFPIGVNLQGDELHLNAGDAFWVEWFPCTDPEVVAKFREAVWGLIQGSYRIVETYSFGEITTAQLQQPVNGRWKKVATYSRAFALRLPFFAKRSILRNG